MYLTLRNLKVCFFCVCLIQRSGPSNWQFSSVFWTFSQVGFWTGNGKVFDMNRITYFGSKQQLDPSLFLNCSVLDIITKTSFLKLNTISHSCFEMHLGYRSWSWKRVGEACGCQWSCRPYIRTCLDEWLEWYEHIFSITLIHIKLCGSIYDTL